MTNLTDSLNRQAHISLQMQTEKIRFLRDSAGGRENNFIFRTT